MMQCKSLALLLVFTEGRFFPSHLFSSENKGCCVYSENISGTPLSDEVREEKKTAGEIQPPL